MSEIERYLVVEEGAMESSAGDPFLERSLSLLTGAIDLHVHGYPEISWAHHNRESDFRAVDAARHLGMRGWVLKSHVWPTMDRAFHLNERLGAGNFEVFGSIALNPLVGGLSLAAVELAAAHGARVVFLPTWGASADQRPDHYVLRQIGAAAPRIHELARESSIMLLDEGGSLSRETKAVVTRCQDLELSLATGHVSFEESLAVAHYASEIGFQHLMITHPLHFVESPDQLRVFCDLGALIEFANAPLLHPDGHLSIRDVHDALGVVGPEHSVLSTDTFSRWVPPEPECLRIFAEQLSYLGWSDEDLRRMMSANPREFLGIEDDSNE